MATSSGIPSPVVDVSAPRGSCAAALSRNPETTLFVAELGRNTFLVTSEPSFEASLEARSFVARNADVCGMHVAGGSTISLLDGVVSGIGLLKARRQWAG